MARLLRKLAPGIFISSGLTTRSSIIYEASATGNDRPDVWPAELNWTLVSAMSSEMVAPAIHACLGACGWYVANLSTASFNAPRPLP
ncbi:hypothetical protein K469DRAFT_716042 [Zopfia rhizophila CBS 207.26]|uniref:Uncharacterized protein n=1 Tax=Zopfia rhizophila CBS 207.26 TaxID=1314779 RepID=A0A6A6DJM6_9PEZI|nr:hypothetical protein K469DRAFT_716042 [Zopfia rhizophila CBS 207.26]